MAVKTKWLLSSDCPSSCTMTGVWRAVAYDQGCVVIFHSPAGCAHVASTMDLGNHYRITADGCPEKGDPVPLISSNLREKDSIFGGIERLHECIAYAVKTCHPECLVIASSCVAGVIGDDVDEEAREAEETYGIPVLSMAFPAFWVVNILMAIIKPWMPLCTGFSKSRTINKERSSFWGTRWVPRGSMPGR